MPSVFRLFSVLPLWLLHAIGAALGWLAFLASPTYRRRFLDNAACAGYALADVRAAVAHAGRMVAEAPRLWLAPESPACEIRNPECVERAWSRGRGIVFLISDFIDNGFERAFAITARKHDLVALRVIDNLETSVTGSGLILMRDAETGHTRVIDPNGATARTYIAWWNQQQQYLTQTAAKFNIDVVDFMTHEDFVKPLAKLFKKRGKRI